MEKNKNAIYRHTNGTTGLGLINPVLPVAPV
jgi:hypothetical protein